jgi:hypothetical protein
VATRECMWVAALVVSLTNHQPRHKRRGMSAALEAAEKVNSKRLLVAQALLPVRISLPLSSKHSQEWLCCSTFSAAPLAAEFLFLQFSHGLRRELLRSGGSKRKNQRRDSYRICDRSLVVCGMKTASLNSVTGRRAYFLKL